MATLARLTLAAAATWRCAGKQLQHLRGHVDDAVLGSAKARARVPITLLNDDDISLYATITVGGTDVRCIMDTGSSEQVIFSSNCTDCGGKMYDCDADGACSWGAHETVQSYGSGECYSTEAHTSLTATSLDNTTSITVKDQMVWLVTAAQLDFELDGTMQCIFGLGPAKSAVEFAKLDYDMLKEYLDDMPNSEAKQWRPMLKELKNHIKFMKGVTLWQEAAGYDTMSFCLHPEFGKNGRLFLNDDAPDVYPEAFTETAASGLYWQVDMSKVKIPFHSGALSACHDKNTTCVAIMDTGTSLIGAPWDFVGELSDMLSTTMPKYGCDPDALGNYPDVEFLLDGHKFALPARSYVCQFDASDWDDGDDWDDEDWDDDDEDDGEWGDEDMGDDDGMWKNSEGKRHRVQKVRRRMRHVHAFKEAHERYVLETKRASGPNKTEDASDSGKNSSLFCAPCFFELDQEQPGVDEWLFGLPFFREYYTSFRTNKKGSQAKNMLFAKTNTNCKPESGRTQDEEELLRATGVQRVKMHKLHIPSSKSTKNRPSGHAKALMARLHK